ncbi:MAG: sigma 54-interacting transcriptional regulator [Nitrococcus sp.]|nr:sigma 54-interacting transcriptional regulator [Nitrococcus sp.]
MAIDEAELDVFVHQMFGDLAAAYLGVMINIGHKLGLYKAMAGSGPMTPNALATKAGTHERYVLEWLNNQVAGGYIAYDPRERAYELSDEHAFVLANPESPFFLPPAFDEVSSMWLGEDKLCEAFRSGKCSGWHESPRLLAGVEAFVRPDYKASLTEAWIAASDGAEARLAAGVEVADGGCGHGASTIVMAQGYPSSTFLGSDYHQDSIETARRRTQAAAVVDRVRFETTSTKDYSGPDDDLVWTRPGTPVRRSAKTGRPSWSSHSRAHAAEQTLYTLIPGDVNERNKLQCSNRYLREEAPSARGIGDLVGNSPALKQVMRDVQQVAATDTTVLITGETGTGKELIARALHSLSGRKDKPMVTLNCATISAGIMESELFGHEKGAFTGALSRKIGRFELADGCTIFLDEIGELAPDLQAKLLRVLEQGEFERVGGTRTFKVDVRVIAATHRDLEQRCRSGEFRPDLYYRLNVFPIHLPPLRERREDIPLLVEHFVQKYATKLGKPISSVPAQMMAALRAYAWPGNIRELQHVIERAAVLTTGSELAFGDWFHPSATLRESAQVATLAEVERAHIIKVLESVDWRISGEHGAAVLLGVPSTTLRSRMERLGIQKPR